MKVCWNGCSYTYGEGFDDADRLSHTYTALVNTRLGWDGINLSQRGSSNHEIFIRSAQAISSRCYDVVITQWSGLNRLWLRPGPDTVLMSNQESKPYHYRDIYLSGRDKNTLVNQLRLLNHDYGNIFYLVDYCKILQQLAAYNQTKIVYINGLVPWQSDLTHQGPLEDLGTVLSDYTKSILDFDNRDDQEIIEFFDRLRIKFSEIDPSSWVNLFESMSSLKLDHAPLDTHPGKKSHILYADMVIQYIKTHFNEVTQ